MRASIMELHKQGVAKRLILSLAAGAVLSGCVYAPPPYAAYDTAPAYSYPTYVGPPISLSFGYYEHRYRGGGYGHYGGRGRGGRGWSGGRGGWRGRH
jgi:hypothetical protein